ncbi:hypothetical protein KC343_g195 [Hortaea werneckii]|uniref:Uncharacterized protein n=1 Tax=Hortaea werneckii TaxID=91943 RepID=A0A3M7F340_HORWE|nr:hypothetical protein KC352_g6732 [Hortaea werneckii]KAI7570187.1 hypothetical protein KC317_g2683 [Hortaea werneckii]KAI7628100.1 hypothetical protein KC346_g393 [Hortaea werneckii]KAI7638270.1 hypothetical protein KC343_g195 [Hortaea werneckii]KAI7683032.1 hypothetical protein KC319_g688 [Hortaea werneckii]
MDQVTEQDVSEHRDVLKGLDAQIARLTRREDELFRKMERGQSRDEAQAVFDGLAKTKAQKEKLGTLRKDEMASFERWVAQDKVRGLQPAAGADDHHLRQESDVRSLPTDVIDLGSDEEVEAPVKQEESTPASSRTARGFRSEYGRKRPYYVVSEPSSPSSQDDSPASNGFQKHPPVTDSHPTLIMNPPAGGAMELRCPYCKTNMNKSGSHLLNGVNGFSLHLNNTHKALLPPGDRFSYKQTFELCSYRAVSQGIVDALRSGKLKAYRVEKVYQKAESEKAIGWFEHCVATGGTVR